jgi:hypothetical protein
MFGFDDLPQINQRRLIPNETCRRTPSVVSTMALMVASTIRPPDNFTRTRSPTLCLRIVAAFYTTPGGAEGASKCNQFGLRPWTLIRCVRGSERCPTRNCANSAKRPGTWSLRQQIWASRRCRLLCCSSRKLSLSGERDRLNQRRIARDTVACNLPTQESYILPTEASSFQENTKPPKSIGLMG